MNNPPKPDHSGNIEFGKKSGKAVGNLIESYPVSQTFTNLSEQVLMKYNAKKEKARAAGKSIINADAAAEAMARKLPEFTAVQKWQDVEVEIKLKKALENMMTD